MNAKAISEKNKGGGCLAAVGAVFTLAGLFFLWFVFLSPLIQSSGSDQWSVPKRLACTQSRWVGVILMLAFAGFWNGLIGISISSMLNGEAD